MPLSTDESRVCPRTGRPIASKSRSSLLRWLFPVTSLLALIWFLIRVIPKPSRATYPCQRVAFPLASGLVVWLLGLTGSALAYRKATRLFARARYLAATICVTASVAFLWAILGANVHARGGGSQVEPDPRVANEPIGVAKGIYPGRVAWIHDPNAAMWPGGDGYTQKPYWHSDECTDPQIVKEMLSKALRTLTGASSDYLAWDKLFHSFNQQMGRGDVGYTPGEKIAIKVNFVLMLVSGNSGAKSTSYYDQIDNAPQLAAALLRQLIDHAGVAPEDISIGDPQNLMPNHWYERVHAECPGVVYLCKNGSSQSGRTTLAPDYSAPFYFSDPCSAHWNGVYKQDYIPDYFAQADYFINFPILKSHNSAGITVAGKNHYGSLTRAPNASGYYNTHNTRPSNSDGSPFATPGMGYYRANVDLMGHPKLGGKTMLVLVDGLYSGRSWDSHPIRWDMAPFDGNWPSSIFLSQDQVAADSVAFDFMENEWDDAAGTINGYPQYPGTEDYLYEAALIPNPPSGTVYDPNNDGGLTESLGVYEHWNNPIDKQYSRNLDPNGTGIDLATAPGLMGDFDGNGVMDANDYAILTIALDSQPGDPNWNPACDISIPSDGIIDEIDFAVFLDQYVPIIDDPNTTDPNVTDPNVIDPNTTDPNATDPNGTDPGAVDPNEADPDTAVVEGQEASLGFDMQHAVCFDWRRSLLLSV